MAARHSLDSHHDWLLVRSSSWRGGWHENFANLLRRLQYAIEIARRWCNLLIHALAWTGRASGVLRNMLGQLRLFVRGPAVSEWLRRMRAAAGVVWYRSRQQTKRLRAVSPVAVLLGFVVLLPLAYLVYCMITVPIEGGLTVNATPSALIVQADNGDVFATRGVFKGEKLSPQELPRDLKDAIVAVEDRHFFEHGGFYLPSLIRAAVRNVRAGGTREGGSTITQQLVRMTYLSNDRTIKRKVQESILSIRLEHQLSKEEILVRYLNTAYFGAGAYGVDAAAKRYFGKRAKDVSLSEAAMLAGLVRAPTTLAPTRNLEGARQRASLVLDAMIQTGAISAEQAATAREHPAALRVPPDNPPGTNYFIDVLAGDVKRLLGKVSADLTVRTTLNLTLQSIADNVISRRLAAEGHARKVTQAALIAMAPDGAILAMVGGRDYNESQFNRATQAKRQPGSLFKLFVYLAALENGFTPQSVLIDRPVQIGNWEPSNYGGRFRGEMTLRTAFANSVNSVAVQLADQVGIRKVIDIAHRLGVESELPALPSLALGSAEVSLMEMTRAVAAMAANAESVEPYSIDSIQNGDHTVLERKNSLLATARNQAARAGMLDLLASVVREGTGRSARVSVPAAGKTGTTQENRDAWFIGFTPDLVVGVWVGNDDNSPTRNVVGGDLPARIWNEFVTRATPIRAKVARARPITLVAATAERATAPSKQGTIRGVAAVRTTAVIELQGRPIQLYGVEGVRGAAARDFRRYLARREVACTPTAGNDEYRCEVDGQDLSRVVLFNGGGRTTPTATPDLQRLEQQARSSRTGISSDDDDE
jgi:penicillin-binding protein 1A